MAGVKNLTDETISMVELGVRAIIKNGEGLILLTKSVRGLKQGTWSLPGGKVNFKERPAEAIKREIKEELDLDFEPVFFTYKEDVDLNPTQDYLTLFFNGKVKGVIKYNPDEISEFRYFSEDEIQNGAVEISLGHKEVLLADDN